jgi:hypothetical protein
MIRSSIAAASLALVLGVANPSLAQQAQDLDALTQRLFTAVRANDIATVRLVLTNGADPMAVDANGQTPAGIAIDRGYFEIAHHILGVRNQRQALNRRENDDERVGPRSTSIRGVAAAPSLPAEERKPDVTWRENTVPGQAAEIPSARLSSPQEAAVITPAMVISGPTKAAQTQQKKAAETPAPAPALKQASTPSGAPAQPAQQTTSLVNLPSLPPGAPNPFDPKSAEPSTLPVLASTTPAARPEAASGDGKPRETSSGNLLGRFLNGITGVFGGGGGS